MTKHLARTLFFLALMFSSAEGLRAQGPCEPIHPPTGGWAVDLCRADPSVPGTMDVILDGTSGGQAALVRVYHETDGGRRMPQVLVIYASGFVRLKQNADPDPPIPFGSSFVLGPAYWSGPASYHHAPSLSRLEIDTRRSVHGPLLLTAEGTNRDFSVSYRMTLPVPSDRRTRLHVLQEVTARAPISIDPGRRADGEGFKIVQASSMFISEDGPCDGGHDACHDTDSVRFIGADLERHDRAFRDVAPSGFLLPGARRLGDTWVDILHRDDTSWQGDTPSVRIALDELPNEGSAGAGVRVQGFLTATTDPNQDNVGVWLHDDGAASGTWQVGQRRELGYWLSAQDDVPDPWAETGLRPGRTVLDFEGEYDCRTLTSAPAPMVTAGIREIAGYGDVALQLDYDLGGAVGDWAEVRCDFTTPLDLSEFDHLRLEWRGDPKSVNRLELGVIDQSGAAERIWIMGWPKATHRAWWGRLVVPFEVVDPDFDGSAVAGVYLAAKKGTEEERGGAGRLAIDNLGAFRAADRPVPEVYETAAPSPAAASEAAHWIATTQRRTGLLKSWEQDSSCLAHTYNQALGLLVFVAEGMEDQASALAAALVRLQNPDGSWFETYDCETSSSLTGSRWEGAAAWAVVALGRYLGRGWKTPGAVVARDKGATWLAGLASGGYDCLGRTATEDHTEGTLDLWWALHASGPAFQGAAARLEKCLLAEYWDGSMGRLKGGRSSWKPFLDNQTWGATFLDAIAQPVDARRALSYAGAILQTVDRSGVLAGFDGVGGPWAVWNEGTAQYVAAGGSGSRALVQDLLAQQRDDGAMPGAPDFFEGGGDRREGPGVWDPDWYGIAPTAWLYFALQGGPFPPFDRAALTSLAVGDFAFWVDFATGGGTIAGSKEAACIPETLCVSGALAGRSEVFLRVVGPKPNGRLWPTLVKFSTSTVDVWVKQLDTGLMQRYRLAGANPGSDTLPGLFDRAGFPPDGSVVPVRSRAARSEEAPVPEPPSGVWLTSPEIPGFRFKVRISAPAGGRPGRPEGSCIPETLCASGAVAGRSEIFLRVVGPKPNGRLWPTLVRFSTSTVEVWIEQESSRRVRYYRLKRAEPGSGALDGLFHRDGFAPG